MVLGLKLHLPTHHISQYPYSNPNRTPQTTLNPLFRIKPIETPNFSHLRLKSWRTSPNRFKSFNLEGSNSDGGGGGGGGAYDLTKDKDGDGDGDRYGGAVWRFYLRCFELLVGSDLQNVGALGLGLPGSMALVCAQVARLLFEAFVEALMVVSGFMFAGVVLMFGVGVSVALLWLGF